MRGGWESVVFVLSGLGRFGCGAPAPGVSAAVRHTGGLAGGRPSAASAASPAGGGAALLRGWSLICAGAFSKALH